MDGVMRAVDHGRGVRQCKARDIPIMVHSPRLVITAICYFGDMCISI